MESELAALTRDSLSILYQPDNIFHLSVEPVKDISYQLSTQNKSKEMEEFGQIQVLLRIDFHRPVVDTTTSTMLSTM